MRPDRGRKGPPLLGKLVMGVRWQLTGQRGEGGVIQGIDTVPGPETSWPNPCIWESPTWEEKVFPRTMSDRLNPMEQVRV